MEWWEDIPTLCQCLAGRVVTINIISARSQCGIWEIGRDQKVTLFRWFGWIDIRRFYLPIFALRRISVYEAWKHNRTFDGRLLRTNNPSKPIFQPLFWKCFQTLSQANQIRIHTEILDPSNIVMSWIFLRIISPNRKSASNDSEIA